MNLDGSVAVDRQLVEDVTALKKFHARNKHRFFIRPCLINSEGVVEAVAIPKTFGDVFEALAYAVFLDMGKDYERWQQIYRTVFQEVFDFVEDKNLKQPVSKLNEMDVGAAERLDVRKNECFFDGKLVGIGKNKNLAKLAGAVAILKRDHAFQWPWLEQK